VLTATWATTTVSALGVVINRSAAAGSAAHLRDPVLLAAAVAACLLAMSVRPSPRAIPARVERPGGAGQIS
jgi:hypothetical protein